MSKSDAPKSEFFAPMESFVAMQRRALDQQRRFAKQGIESQHTMVQLFRENVEASESMQRKGLDTMHTGWESMLRSMEATMPGGRGMFDQFVAAMDDGFDASDNAVESFWSQYEQSMADGFEAYESFLDEYEESLDDSVDQYLDMLDDVERQQ